MDTPPPLLPPRSHHPMRRNRRARCRPMSRDNSSSGRMRTICSRRPRGHNQRRVQIHPHWNVPTGRDFPNYYNQRNPDFSCLALPVITNSPSDLSDDLKPQYVARMLSPSVIVDRPEHRRGGRDDGDGDGELRYGDLEKDKPCMVWEDLKYPEEMFERDWAYHQPFGPDRTACEPRVPQKPQKAASNKSTQATEKKGAEKRDDDSLAVCQPHSKRSSRAGSERPNDFTIGFTSVDRLPIHRQHANLVRLLQLVQSNAEQSRELSSLLSRLIAQSSHDPYEEEFMNHDLPRPFVKPIREQPEDPGPKIAVAGGDSPSPPRDTRFFGQGHMVDRADVNAEKDSVNGNNDEKTSNMANMDNMSTLPAPTSALASASHSPAPGSDIVACPMMTFSEPSGHYAETHHELDLPTGDVAMRSYHSQDPPKRFGTFYSRKYTSRDFPPVFHEKPSCDCARKMSHIGSPKYTCPGYANCHVCPVNTGTRCQHVGGSCYWCRRRKEPKMSSHERSAKERVHKSQRKSTRRRGENKKSDVSSFELSNAFIEQGWYLHSSPVRPSDGHIANTSLSSEIRGV